jgi:hypothetical protein
LFSPQLRDVQYISRCACCPVPPILESLF